MRALIRGGPRTNLRAMNARLHDLIVEAEAKLAPEAQERLAEIVAEPFAAADPAEVEALFRRRG